METILDRIAGKRAERILAQSRALPLEAVKGSAQGAPPALDAADMLRRWPHGSNAIIAEIKRRSPSKGDLFPGLDPGALAAAYERGGAYAVSCLVEPDHFGGSLDDLRAARSAMTIPLLYKDFIVDRYQLWQARANGADMALLIAALLGPSLGDYVGEAREAGLTPLVEIHDEEDLRLAIDSGAVMIGVNNRDLRTFVTDLATSERLIPLMPPGTLAVAESGIGSVADMERLARAGAKAFLIGESLVRSTDPEAETRLLAGGSAR